MEQFGVSYLKAGLVCGLFLHLPRAYIVWNYKTPDWEGMKLEQWLLSPPLPTGLET